MDPQQVDRGQREVFAIPTKWLKFSSAGREGYDSKGAIMSLVLFCSYVVQYGDSVLYVI